MASGLHSSEECSNNRVDRAAVDALAAAIEAVKQGMERHALALEMDLLEPASEWVQFEPEDPHGAELRSALAAAVQVTPPAT